MNFILFLHSPAEIWSSPFRLFKFHRRSAPERSDVLKSSFATVWERRELWECMKKLSGPQILKVERSWDTVQGGLVWAGELAYNLLGQISLRTPGAQGGGEDPFIYPPSAGT